MRKTFPRRPTIFRVGGLPIDGTARAVVTHISSNYDKRGHAILRLEEPLSVVSTTEGLCTWCRQLASRKMVNTNQGTLALCEQCIRKATTRYKKQAKSKQLPTKKAQS